jgi:outer membrane autotransporter protein
MDTNAIIAAFYGSYYFPESFYIDWIMAYGFHDFETDRNIRYSNVDYIASSTPEGNQYDVALSLGKDFNWQQWLLNSYARVEYQVVDIESYDETGGHGFALRVGEQAVNSFTSALGGNLIYNWSQSWGILSPGVRFEWEHQYMDNSRTINTSFVNSSARGGMLSLATDKTDRNYFNLGASINATFSHGHSAFLLYETRLGQEHISSHTVEIGVRIPF